MLIALLKLALIPASIGIGTLAARRFGHGIGGVVSGLPLIAAPIIAVLLIDHPAAAVSTLAHATMASIPATFVFIVCFAWCARRPGPNRCRCPAPNC